MGKNLRVACFAPIFSIALGCQTTRANEQSDVEGIAIIKCTIFEDGAVRNCNVMKNTSATSNMELIQKLEATRGKPAFSNGRPIETAYTFNLRFKK